MADRTEVRAGATADTERFLAGEPGVYAGIDFRTYISLDAVNWHTLEPFRESAKYARHCMTQPPDATDTQVFGEATHAAILEPGRFRDQYVVMPRFEGHPNSNAYKAEKAAWTEANASRVALTADELAELEAIGEAVRSHPVAAAIVSGRGRNELSVVWRDAGTGVLCKGRIDRLCRVPLAALEPFTTTPDADAICLVDIKTTRALKPFFFDRERQKFGYQGQMAMYVDGVMSHNPAPVVPLILAIENAPAFDVVVYRLDDDLIEHGRGLYRRLLGQLLECRTTKRWPGISTNVLTLTPAVREQREVDDGDC